MVHEKNEKNEKKRKNMRKKQRQQTKNRREDSIQNRNGGGWGLQQIESKTHQRRAHKAKRADSSAAGAEIWGGGSFFA